MHIICLEAPTLAMKQTSYEVFFVSR